MQDERSVDVIAAVVVNPHDSTRRIAKESGISQTTVCRILKGSKYHPYHINLHQQLEGEDYQNRVVFCNWLSGKNRRFHRSILWTDEATFKSNGDVNIHNAHYWSQVNPHLLRKVDNQHRWSLNVWCGIIRHRIIGPYFFQGALNGGMYTDFLKNILNQLLEDVPLAT